MEWNSLESHHLPLGQTPPVTTAPLPRENGRYAMAETRLHRFESLVRREEWLVFQVCRHLCSNDEVAERISEGAFLALYRGEDDLVTEDTRHRRSLLRLAVKISRFEGYLSPLRFPLIEGMSPTPVATRPHLDLSNLGRAEREVMVLRFVGRLELETIAEILDCPAEEVRSHLWNGMQALDSGPAVERPTGW